MDKFSVNFGALEEHLRPKAPVYKYEDVKHRLRKVAFDIVRFVDTDNIDGLWQIQNTDDGEVIVAMYSEESSTAEKTASAWRAIADKSGNINLFYKNDPVTKVSLAKLGMADADPNAVCITLAENLSTNSKLLDGLLASLSSEERGELLKSHPELVRGGQWPGQPQEKEEKIYIIVNSFGERVWPDTGAETESKASEELSRMMVADPNAATYRIVPVK